MTVEIRRAGSVHEFAAVETAAEHVDDTAHYLEGLFASGSSRPEWCFVAWRGKAQNATRRARRNGRRMARRAWPSWRAMASGRSATRCASMRCRRRRRVPRSTPAT